MRPWHVLLPPAIPDQRLRRAAVLVLLLMERDVIIAAVIIMHETVQLSLRPLILEGELIVNYLALHVAAGNCLASFFYVSGV